MFNNFSFKTENIHPLLPTPYNLILPLIPLLKPIFHLQLHLYS